MTSGYIPPREEPDLDEILAALKELLDEDPRTAEMPAEEVARELVRGGHLQREPSPPLVAEALQALEAEEGNPT
jgi:hypothetical protein